MQPVKVMRQHEPHHHDTLDAALVHERLLKACEYYVHNHLPTYLIRISDMTLITRNHLWETLCPGLNARVDAIVQEVEGIPESRLDAWCQQRVRRFIKFAIFSHRWGSEEPEFHHLSSDRNGRKALTEPIPQGYQKLVKFCEKARAEYDCSYAWSDTCCINKESSAQLEEAIRSMYRWYRDAEVCIVHLAASSSLEDFPDEPWFTRGWTLQELLAPTTMKFYGKDWEPILSVDHVSNDKDSLTVRRHIALVTGIPDGDLVAFHPSCDRVSEKMMWMSKRRTTRGEDIAYSLIGIFDVTMPIAYGEGSWAFHRLLETIAQRSWDPGFLAWTGNPSPHSLILPSSPECYVLDSWRANVLRLLGFGSLFTGDPSYSITKTGLRVRLLLVPICAPDPASPCDAYALVAHRRAIPLNDPSMDLSPSPFGFRIAKSNANFALGIVNYRADGRGNGEIRAGTHYLGVLLRKVGQTAWRKEITEKVVVLDCRNISMKGRLEMIVLAHDNGLLPSVTAQGM